MTTILAPTTDTTQPTGGFLTPADVLDIQCALQNAAAADTTTLTIQDQQALALLTYHRPTCTALAALLIERILDGTYRLPLDERRANLLLRLIDRLPVVTDDDVDAWLAARDIETTSAVDRIIGTLAAYTATRSREPGSDLLFGALQTVIRVGKPAIPLHDVPSVALHEIDTAMGDLDADGLIPPPQDGPVERAERIIAARAARHNDSVGDALKWALRVIVAEMAHAAPTPISDTEQYAAHQAADRLVEQAAEYVEWGYEVTIEDLARGIVGTYGATYVETAPAVTA